MTTVPFALDAAGQVVTALTAPRDARYTCLECGSPLGVRRGPERRWHFFHLPGVERACGGESVTHRAAKRLLAQTLQRELERSGQVAWHIRCAGADGPCRAQALLPRAFRPVGWTGVVEEVASGPYRFDVAVVAGARVLFGLEVFFRHAVPEAKAAALDVPWLELLAEDLLAHRPRVPVRGSGEEARCPACAVRLQRLEERAQDDAVRDEMTGAFETQARLVADTWTAILNEARRKAVVPAQRQPKPTEGKGTRPTTKPQRPGAPPVEDEATRVRRERWASLQAWVNERTGQD